jgi:hypothetical protein
VQATLEPLLRRATTPPRCGPLADVASVELVTERTIRRSSALDLVPRALCDIPILPVIIRGARGESASIARSRSASVPSASRAGSAQRIRLSGGGLLGRPRRRRDRLDSTDAGAR